MTSLTAHAQAGAPALPGPHEPCVLLKLGEIVLKGGNRRQFEQRLHSNIRQAMDDAGLSVRIWQRYGVIMLRAADDAVKGDGEAGGAARAEAAVDKIAERARDVMGIARVCRAVRVARQPEAAIETAVAMMAGKTGSFAVRARRRDKRFPVTSAQLATTIGTRVREEYGYQVNLKHPDNTVFVEVDQHEVFVYTDGQPGLALEPVQLMH